MSDEIECAVIAAAGFGSRLGQGMPKCLVDVGGQSILQRLIHSLDGVVKKIIVVAGYNASDVIDHCKHIVSTSSIQVVVNENFASTNTAYSMRLGARGLKGRVLFLDGDLVIEKDSLHQFMSSAKKHDMYIGVSTHITEGPVYIDGSVFDGDELRISGFSRDKITFLEWGNVFVGKASIMDEASGFVYTVLEDYLPMFGRVLNMREIDTLADYQDAIRFIKESIDCQD